MTDTIPVLPRIGSSVKKPTFASAQPVTEKLSDVFDDLDTHEKTKEETDKKPIFWNKDRIMMAAIGFVLVIIIIVIMLTLYQSYNKKQPMTNIKQTAPVQASCLSSKIPSKDELLNTLTKIKDNTKKFIKPSANSSKDSKPTRPLPKFKKPVNKTEFKLPTVSEEPEKTFITEEDEQEPEQDQEQELERDDPDAEDNELSNKFVNELAKNDIKDSDEEVDEND
jgi:hypothetical protein